MTIGVKILLIFYPLLKEIDETKSLREQTIPTGKSHAYYAQKPKLSINNKLYIIYMQWNDKMHRSRIEKWISENPAPVVEEVLPFKNKCIHYDFKKGLCGNIDNPLFNQPCDNVSFCHYYSEKVVYITSKDKMKTKICLCCGLQAEYEYLEIGYTQNQKVPMVTKKLQILKCNHCNKSFINIDLYKNYIKNKGQDNIDVKFIAFEK